MVLGTNAHSAEGIEGAAQGKRQSDGFLLLRAADLVPMGDGGGQEGEGEGGNCTGSSPAHP
jgi:hypothetical protein